MLSCDNWVDMCQLRGQSGKELQKWTQRVRTALASKKILSEPVSFHPHLISFFFPSSQVRLEWPTDLAVNPMDNSLYVLENNVILRITENHQVCIKMPDYHCKTISVEAHYSSLTEFRHNYASSSQF